MFRNKTEILVTFYQLSMSAAQSAMQFAIWFPKEHREKKVSRLIDILGQTRMQIGSMKKETFQRKFNG